LTDDAQFDEFFKLMDEKGIKKENVMKHMHTFAGLEIEEALKKKE